MASPSQGQALASDSNAQAAFQKKMSQMQIDQKERVAKVQASMLGLSYMNLEKFPIGPETLKLITPKEAQALQLMPFYHTSNEMRVGAVRPGTPPVLEFVEQLKSKYHVPVKLYLISDRSFELAYKQYAALPSLKEAVRGVQISGDDLKKFQADITMLTDLQSIIATASISDTVTAVIALGLQINASDIHIETEETDVKIRYRIDGVLNDAANLSHELFPRISSRLKLLSGLKLNITNTPQDGRFTIYMAEDKIDVRVSILPTTFGESIVMRLLRASASGVRFEDLGLQGSAARRLEAEITKPNGMIVTTGPTGSGKTTTLYSILIKLNDSETKIITLEDPVEYKLQGINQSQVDHSSGYDFANGLRAILRQDPDVVMVGEIRDLETADVAINAALTGHLVISTLHTNSAAAAIPRFLSMGVKSYLLSPSINAIIGQRLVRRVCPHCKIKTELDETTIKQIDKQLVGIPEQDLGEFKSLAAKDLVFYKGAGCKECHGLGYKGRVGIYEIMTMSKEVEKLIASERVSEFDVQSVAVKEGMITMIQDGILKALHAQTTIEEVFRVAKSLE
jgi:type IV pilus assembly protein PilB